MSADELVEKVAAIIDPIAFDPGGWKPAKYILNEHRSAARKLARVSVDLVVDACAKVAEAPVHDPDQWNRDGYVTQYQAKPCVAAAIRSHSHSSGATGVEL